MEHRDVTRGAIGFVLALALGVGFGAGAARAQEAATGTAPAAPPAPAEEPLIDPAAVEPVKRMVETLTGAERFSFAVEKSYDAIQFDGETVEFGGRQEQTVRRPDRIRVESWDRDGRHLQTFYDGKAVTVYDDRANAFARADRTGDIDQLIDFLRDDVGLRMPLADFFSANLRQILVDNVIAARPIGVEKIQDEVYDHVALRTREGVGMQLWIRQGKEALPLRLVLTFERARGRPQFRATFYDWDLSPRVPDRMFAFQPPKGARSIPFLLPKRGAAAAPAEEGGL
jgi:hypothetical protein